MTEKSLEMNRFEGLKYSEIALQLDLSIKTVEKPNDESIENITGKTDEIHDPPFCGCSP